MPTLVGPVLDVLAIGLLVFAVYFPRHRRADMVVAFLTVNIGVLAVATVLDGREAGAGLGLGLFGLLSIIRLRSSDIDHQEVAYYFGSLTLGLLGGLAVSPSWLVPVLMAAVLTALYVGDHPRLFGRYRTQVMTLDAAHTDEAALLARLESLLGGRVHVAKVRKVDLVDDTTVVEVRFSPGSTRPAARVRPRVVAE